MNTFNMIYRCYKYSNMSNTFSELNTINTATLFLTMIDPERFMIKSTWYDIGKVLYNITNGNSPGLSLWVDETLKVLNQKDTPNFITKSVEVTCNSLYPTFENNSLTIKTLAWYAAHDSPASYNDWYENWRNKALDNSLDGKYTDVVDSLYRMNWLDVVFAEEQWYRFKDNIWIQSSETSFTKSIINDAISTYEEYFNSLGDSEKLEKSKRIIKKLRSVSFRSFVIDELSNMFDGVLDSNYNILGTPNGVIELIDRNLIFRDGKPEDYISMTTNVPYNTDFTWQHSSVRDCMGFFEPFFAEKSSLHNFWKLMSSTLNGNGRYKKVHAFKGDDRKVKMIVIKLLKEVYDGYFVSRVFDIPHKKYHTFKGKRVAFHDCDREHSLNNMHIKMITGGDSFYGFGKEVKISPVVFLTYTDTINIPNCDEATIKRLNLVPLTGSYTVDDDDELLSLAPAFLWIMVNYFSYETEEGIKYHPIDPKDIISYQDYIPSPMKI